MNISQCRELDRIHGEPTEVEWKKSHGFFKSQTLAEILKMMIEVQCELEQFTGRESSSCQCTTTSYGEKKESKNCVLRIPKS